MVIAKQRIKAKAHEMKQAKQELVDKGELSKSEANRIRVYPYSQYDYSNKDHQKKYILNKQIPFKFMTGKNELI